MQPCRFEDRAHAGRLLAEALIKFAGREDVIVLGLPRGGVPVAYEVAKVLNVPLDVMVVRKLGVPGHEELAMGAIASGGVRVIHESVMRAMGVSKIALEKTTSEQLKELERRERIYRGTTEAPDLEGKTVILIDDGIATGSTFCAAAQAARLRNADQVVIAAPTAALDSCQTLVTEIDELVVLMVPDDFHAVGLWYEDFTQTTDAQVTRLLAEAKQVSA